MNYSIILLVSIGLIIFVAIAVLLISENKQLKVKINKKSQAAVKREEVKEEVKYELTDYDIYIMSPKEKRLYICLAAIVIYCVGYLFYRSFIIPLLFIPAALYYPKIKVKDIIKKRKEQLAVQFKDALYSLSTSLSAGKPIEMAFNDALKDLEIIYSNPNTHIIKEFLNIVGGLKMNIPIEELVDEFANRAKIEDIKNFADVFQVGKRAGGNLIHILKNTTDIISDKLEIKQEIDIIISQRKFEQKVLNFMPIGLIILISIGAPDFMEPVFNTIIGKLIMTFAIILFVIAYFISRKITEIEV